jgi:pilus assembly protein Flp/PilA
MFGSQHFQKLLRDNRGATAIEYGLIVGLLVIGIIVALEGVADENTGLWAVLTEKVQANM